MILGEVFALHNGVTWLSASESNVVQKLSADRSSGGISTELVDACQRSSLRTFSKAHQLVSPEVAMEQRVNEFNY